MREQSDSSEGNPAQPAHQPPARFDSTNETKLHIARVRNLLFDAVNNFCSRGDVHDASKLQEPEKTGFDTCTVRLRALEYGSPEYKAALAELKPFLDHHYAANSHHPEHYPDGIEGMSLFDVLEMLVDWKAATERMAGGGDIRRSLEINRERFKISPQMMAVLENTVREFGW